MTLVKRPPLNLLPPRGFRKELVRLYARRSVIDELIHSLETYDRMREKAIPIRRFSRSA